MESESMIFLKLFLVSSFFFSAYTAQAIILPPDSPETPPMDFEEGPLFATKEKSKQKAEETDETSIEDTDPDTPKPKPKPRRAPPPRTSPSPPSFGWHLLPFGVGHFVDGRYLAGTFYSLLQVTGVVLIGMNYGYSKKTEDLNLWVSDQDIQGAQISSSGDGAALSQFLADRDAYFASEKKAIDTQKTLFYTGLSLAICGYALDILHRIVTGPPAQSAAYKENGAVPRRKKKKKPTPSPSASLLLDIRSSSPAIGASMIWDF